MEAPTSISGEDVTLYNLIAINKYDEKIRLNESPLSIEEIIADDIEETRRVFAKPSMGKCKVEIVPAISEVFVVVEYGYSAGDETTVPLQSFSNIEDAIGFIAEIAHKNNGILVGNSGLYTMNEPEYGKIDYILRIQKVPFRESRK